VDEEADEEPATTSLWLRKMGGCCCCVVGVDGTEEPACSSPSPCTSGMARTRSFRKSNLSSSKMHCFLYLKNKTSYWSEELHISNISYRWAGLSVFAFFADVIWTALVRRDSTNNSNARGKHKSKGTNIELLFKRILTTRLIIRFYLGKKDIDDDWNRSSNLANFFICLHDFLYPGL